MGVNNVCNLCSNVIYINSALSIICFTCSNVLLYTNVIIHSRCVFVFGLIATLLGYVITQVLGFSDYPSGTCCVGFL